MEAAAACVMLTVRLMLPPETVNEPVRCDVVVLVAAVTVKLLTIPAAPEPLVIVIHVSEGLGAAVQLTLAVTLTL
jgi:hypothetical protein